MDFTPFFSGGASREESASAILAMSLAGVPSFRRFFLDLVAPQEAEKLSDCQWAVSVEENNVDVRIDTKDVVILIENKIKAGSVQSGQLLRYYADELRRAVHHKRVIMVYLAPGGAGAQEVEAVRKSVEFLGRPTDVAVRISWQDLDGYESGDDDIFRRPVRTGLTDIVRALRTSGGVRYPVIGDRVTLVAIHDQVFARLERESPVPLTPWRDSSYYQALTKGTAITAWLGFDFNVDEESREPLNVIDETGLISITIRHQFKLAERAAKLREYADWWRTCQEARLRTCGCDEYAPNGGGWLAHERTVRGSIDELVEAVSRSGLELLAMIGSELARSGVEWKVPDDP